MIIVNGSEYSGNNIVISNNKIIIDGNDVTPDSKIIEIKIDSDINELKVDCCDKIEINGNVYSVKTQSGDVDISGDVSGSIKTMSGDVDCGNVTGSISTMSGDIKHRKF